MDGGWVKALRRVHIRVDGNGMRKRKQALISCRRRNWKEGRPPQSSLHERERYQQTEKLSRILHSLTEWTQETKEGKLQENFSLLTDSFSIHPGKRAFWSLSSISFVFLHVIDHVLTFSTCLLTVFPRGRSHHKHKDFAVFAAPFLGPRTVPGIRAISTFFVA